MATEQRSEEWYAERNFRFTGSRISEILGAKGVRDSYISEVVEKSLFPDLEEPFTSKLMERGVELEPSAFKKLTEILGKRFIQTETCGFFPYEDYGGASPDGLTSDDGVIEIKCPKAKTFFNVVKYNYIDSKYYDQMQMEMLSANRSKAYYFNYFVDTNGKEYWHLILVEKDEQRINFIKARLKEAKDLALADKLRIEKNKQF